MPQLSDAAALATWARHYCVREGKIQDLGQLPVQALQSSFDPWRYWLELGKLAWTSFGRSAVIDTAELTGRNQPEAGLGVKMPNFR